MKNKKNSSVKTSTLAPVQRLTLEYLRNFIAENGFAPTLKDISQHIGVKSPSTAHFHLERLVEKGFIERGEDGSLSLMEQDSIELGPTAVKLVGTIAAGSPIEAFEGSETIEIPPSMIDGRGEVFCLEVSGDSMIEDHICDGDIVIIRKQDTADNGKTVVALLEDNTATLKRIRRLRDGSTMLIPANSKMKPIKANNVKVQGELIGVIRQLH